jgi:hypothetical protein
MPNDKAKYYIRIGSNAEKEFIYKTISLYSGLITKANLFESSPGMISGLILSIYSSMKKDFIIDPVTHVFSFNPNNPGSIRTWQKVLKKNAEKKIIEDLHLQSKDEIDPDWIRPIENPTSAQKDKVEVKGMKRAYRKLSDQLFPNELNKVIGLRALIPEDFTPEVIQLLNQNTYKYQKEILRLSKYNIEKYSDFTDDLPSPSFILSPYFCINSEKWFIVMKDIWNSFSSIFKDENIALVLHIDLDYLSSNSDLITSELIKSNCKNIFIWLNAYNEDSASQSELHIYARLVKELTSRQKTIYNLYSGGFSSFLIPFGLIGIANGPGYGMERDAEPVIGGLPTAQYYIPTLHKRLPVAEALTLILENQLGESKDSFHKQICNCPICQKGIQNSATDIYEFFAEPGERVEGVDGITRRFPTSQALERCKYHFMLSRLIEYGWAKKASHADVFNKLQNEKDLWKLSNQHLIEWETTLKDIFIEDDSEIFNDLNNI